jgi:hypothetical protein
VVGWVGGGPAMLVRDAGQTDIRGSPEGLAGPWFVVGSRCLRASVASVGWLLIAGSRVPRACRAAIDPADGMCQL